MKISAVGIKKNTKKYNEKCAFYKVALHGDANY